MLKVINGFSTAIGNYISPSDTILHIPMVMVDKLNKALDVGDHTFLTLVGYNGRNEIVKYTKTKDVKTNEIQVERDAGLTGALNFPPNTCLSLTFNTVVLDEYIREAVQQEVARQLKDR